uniref:HNH domain-containing protein n=1 Tax=viral metagenome TaxID=1070528 RepID=A0A6C0D3T0_9ZZZZ
MEPQLLKVETPFKPVEISSGVFINIINIEQLLSDFNNQKYNLYPVVQRALPAWPEKTVNKFRATILVDILYGNGTSINPILLYKYQQGQLEHGENYEFLVLEGGNRTRTIIAFILGTFMDFGSKKNVVPPYCIMKEPDGIDTAFFFNNADLAINHQQQKRIRSKVLTPDQQHKFLSYRLQVNTYTKRMELSELGEKFLLVQQGVKVSGSDQLKLADCPFTLHMYQQDPQFGQEGMISALSHADMKVEKYWCQWLAKIYLMRFPPEGMTHFQVFEMEDSKIAGVILNNHPWLTFNEEQFASFKCMMRTFYRFISNLTKKLSLPAFFASFMVLSMNEVTEETLSSHINYFVQHVDVRKCWVGRKNEKSGLKYTADEVTFEYRRIYNIMSQYTTLFVEEKRINIPRKTRAICESLVFCERDEALCPIGCGRLIKRNKKRNYVMGHVKARAHGGKMTPDNLLPICYDCNRDMHDQHMYEYQNNCYPNAKPIAAIIESIRLSDCDTDDEPV